MTGKLTEIRAEIDRLDRELLRILCARSEMALRASEHKRSEDLQLVDGHRERSILRNAVRENKGPLPDSAVAAIMREVIKHCRKLVLDPSGASRKSEGGGTEARQVRVGHAIFGAAPEFIAGPCAVEARPGLLTVARALAALGVKVLRAGAFKPRTSPYAFQGHGEEGLAILRSVADEVGMAVVSEVADTAQVDTVVRYVDLVQVGARAMHNTELLRALGGVGKPVFLKRGLCATLDEMVMATEYLRVHGNEDIILCERGVRTFETLTRNTLDISAVPLLKARTGLPVVVDVSHAAGRRDILPDLAAAAFAVGAAGVMVEVHDNPDVALSDGQQQLTPEQFRALRDEVARRLRW